MNKEQLIAFEEDIAGLFNDGKIPYPVHLSDGNEDGMIDAFKSIAGHDWVLGSWRMHYQCLLHGVPPAELKAAIMAGKSMELCFPEYRILSSAIVGGVLPIAVGIAMGIKRAGGLQRVHCFVGDMTFETGIAHEAMKYSNSHSLPVRWIIEDNGMSVCTPTKDVWQKNGAITYTRYAYSSKYPHAGAGKRVQF